MSTIAIPQELAAFADLDVVAAGGGEPRCSEVADSVQAASITLSDVVTETRAVGLAGTGLTADAAGYEFGRFATRADAATAAFETAALALDVYAEEVLGFDLRADQLEDDRVQLNSDIRDLVRDVQVDGDGHVVGTTAQIAAWQDRAAGLRTRRTDLRADHQSLVGDLARAEDRAIKALRGVDTLAEGQAAATDPGRADVPALVGRLKQVQHDPYLVHQWWQSLTPEQRQALKTAVPELVGGTDGIPVNDRDDANRGQLEHDLDHLGDLEEQGVDLSDEQRTTLKNALATHSALGTDGLTDPTTGEPVRTFLINYQPDAYGGDGRGAVAYGDPDTADHTAVVVPGFSHSLGTIDGLGNDGRNVYTESQDGEHSVSVVVWPGYDAPDFTNHGGLLDQPGAVLDGLSVAKETEAENGGHLLDRFVDGLRATDQGPTSHLSVIAHSYGSTTAAHGAHDGLNADDLVLLGSPGAGDGIHNVDELGFGGQHVYVGAADNDPITWLGGDSAAGLGPDPSQASFGGIRIDVDPGEDFGLSEVGSIGFGQNHSGYFDNGSKSLDNLGDIVRGADPDTVEGRHEPARDLLGHWVKKHDHIPDGLEDFIGDLPGNVKDGAGHVVDGIEDGAGKVGGILIDGLNNLNPLGG